MVGLVPRPVAAQGQTASAASAATTAGSFRAVTPARLLDTRIRSGGSRVAPRGTLHLLVDGRGGVPATGVSAVFLTVVVTRPTAAGYVTAYADGSARPGTSNVNFRTGYTVSNQVTVRVGANGRVALNNTSTGYIDLVADVYGYTIATSAGAGSFVTTAPARLLDTRTPPTRTPGPHAALTVPVAGHAGVPTTGVGAVALTVTVAGPRASGSIDVYPAGGHAPPQPTTSFDAGVTTAGATIVPVGVGGAVTLANDSAGTTPLVIDVAGYFTAGAAGPTGTYVPVTPMTMQLDSPSPIPARSSATAVRPYDGVVPLPHGPMAVLLEVTITSPTTGFVVPSQRNSGAFPLTSALSVRAGSTASGLVVAAVGEIGGPYLWNGGASPAGVHVAVLGFFVAAPGGAAVTGRVTDAGSGAGLAGVVVRLWDKEPANALDYGVIYGTVTTGADGRYTVAGVWDGGDYMVCFDPRNVSGGPPHTVYDGQCWKNRPYDVDYIQSGFPTDPTVVHTAVGATTTGIDAALTSQPGGSLSGTVSDAGGVPLAGLHVQSDRVDGTTDADGHYFLDGVPAGSQTVHVGAGSVHGPGAPYGYLPADSAAVTVTAGSDTSGVNVRLDAQSRIVGHVSTSTGAHLTDAYVKVFGPDGSTYFGDIDASDGSYVVTGFTGAAYAVCFYATDSATSKPKFGWANQCYDGSGWPTWDTPPPGTKRVSVGAGEQRSVDVTVVPAGSIAGTVRAAAGGAGVDNVEVVVYDPVTGERMRGANTNSDGTYVIGPGMPPTTTGYTVCVGATANLGSACYRDVPWPGPSLPTGATPVTVPSNALHSGVDFDLPPA